jgi:hypothetical protein
LVLVVWILLAFLASLLALLTVPVDLAFSVQRHDGRQEGSGTLGWLFGLVRLRLGKPKVRAQAKPECPKIKRRHRKRGGARHIMAMLRIEGFGWRLLRLAQDLLRRIHIRDLSLEVRLGLDDPADTGRLWAVVGPLSAILTLPPVTRVAIEPEFTSEVLEVDGKGRIRIIPIQLLFVILVFVLSPSTLRALYTMGVEAR